MENCTNEFLFIYSSMICVCVYVCFPFYAKRNRNILIFHSVEFKRRQILFLICLDVWNVVIIILTKVAVPGKIIQCFELLCTRFEAIEFRYHFGWLFCTLLNRLTTRCDKYDIKNKFVVISFQISFLGDKKTFSSKTYIRSWRALIKVQKYFSSHFQFFCFFSNS